MTDSKPWSDAWVDEQVEALFGYPDGTTNHARDRAIFRAGARAGMEEAAKTVADENCGSDFDCDGDCHNEDADAIRSRAAQIKGVSE